MLEEEAMGEARIRSDVGGRVQNWDERRLGGGFWSFFFLVGRLLCVRAFGGVTRCSLV